MYAEQQQKYNHAAAALAGGVIGSGNSRSLDGPMPASSQSEVKAAMSRLDNAVTENGQLVYALMERLQAVLVPVPATAGSNALKAGPSCKLACEMHEQTDRVLGANNTLREMLSCLAL